MSEKDRDRETERERERERANTWSNGQNARGCSAGASGRARPAQCARALRQRSPRQSRAHPPPPRPAKRLPAPAPRGCNRRPAFPRARRGHTRALHLARAALSPRETRKERPPCPTGPGQHGTTGCAPRPALTACCWRGTAPGRCAAAGPHSIKRLGGAGRAGPGPVPAPGPEVLALGEQRARVTVSWPPGIGWSAAWSASAPAPLRFLPGPRRALWRRVAPRHGGLRPSLFAPSSALAWTGSGPSASSPAGTVGCEGILHTRRLRSLSSGPECLLFDGATAPNRG